MQRVWIAALKVGTGVVRGFEAILQFTEIVLLVGVCFCAFEKSQSPVGDKIKKNISLSPSQPAGVSDAISLELCCSATLNSVDG